MNNENTNNVAENRFGQSGSGKFEKLAFYVFIVTIVLAPLAFFWSTFVSIEMIKTLVISVGTITSAVLIAFSVLKDKKVYMPPTTLCRTSILLIISIIISSALSLHFGKSFFGQVFEIGNASFLILMFLAGCVSFNLVRRDKDRAVVMYFGIVSSYLVLFVLHLLRIIFGPNFMTLGILKSPTATLLGTWYSLSSLSAVILIISVFAVLFLTLSKRMKIIFLSLVGISSVSIILIGDIRVWYVLAIMFFIVSILLGIENWKTKKSSTMGFIALLIKSLSIIPIVIFLVSTLLVYQGQKYLKSTVVKLEISNTEVSLPWQTTLEISSSAIQNYPLFGVGSNYFSDAYMAYKPLVMNNSNGWNIEFPFGVGFIPSFVATHGVVGSILWILLFVFFGIITTKVLRNLPADPEKRFMLTSSLAVTVFVWILSFVSIPVHAILFLTFIFTSIFIALSVEYGILPSRIYSPVYGSKIAKVFTSIVALVILVLVVWGLIYIKKTLSFAYFAKGLHITNSTQDYEKADQAFSTALKIDKSDAFWRAKAEISILIAQKLASSINSSMSASTTQAVLTDINNILNRGIADAKNATAYNPKNYYNYVSEARVAEVAAGIKMQNGYENAINSYANAISLNPLNPALYYSLASFEAQNGKYDEALRDLGRALQVKNNYLDAVFLLSQIYATKGDLNNAIIAAGLAVQLNPENPVLLFQLGLLRYNAKDYSGALLAFEQAVKYQSDYANAKYFLGLSAARLNNTAKAIAAFDDLAKANPENEEIALILSNLQRGRSIFSDAKPPVTTTPEKRSSLPLKEKK
jgi:tetratricopeptide (TPR) repeat protein